MQNITLFVTKKMYHDSHKAIYHTLVHTMTLASSYLRSKKFLRKPQTFPRKPLSCYLRWALLTFIQMKWNGIRVIANKFRTPLMTMCVTKCGVKLNILFLEKFRVAVSHVVFGKAISVAERFWRKSNLETIINNVSSLRKVL